MRPFVAIQCSALNSPKVMSLSPSEFRTWVLILLAAQLHDHDGGSLPPLPTLAFLLRSCDLDALRLDLEALTHAGLIEAGDPLRIHDWATWSRAHVRAPGERMAASRNSRATAAQQPRNSRATAAQRPRDGHATIAQQPRNSRATPRVRASSQTQISQHTITADTADTAAAADAVCPTPARRLADEIAATWTSDEWERETTADAIVAALHDADPTAARAAAAKALLASPSRPANYFLAIARGGFHAAPGRANGVATIDPNQPMGAAIAPWDTD